MQKVPTTESERKQPNRTGIPIPVKNRFEAATGLPLDDVQVHYNSPMPAQFQALAFTQGSQVHIGPGQERCLEHELGHVIQQKMGIVRPTGSIGGVPINDNPDLERSADDVIQRMTAPNARLRRPTHKQIVQMLRKRVAGDGPTVAATDLYYDKTDGKYHKNMIPGTDTQVTIAMEEMTEYNAIKGKARSGHTILLVETENASDDERFVLNPIQNARGQHGQVVTNGDVVPDAEEPPAIRLYAEGNMSHADVLASNMTTKEKYKAFQDLDGENFELTDRLPIIKATEFDDKPELIGRYTSKIKDQTTDLFIQGRDDAIREHKTNTARRAPAVLPSGPKNKLYRDGYNHAWDNWDTSSRSIDTRIAHSRLEASFGGKTGDFSGMSGRTSGYQKRNRPMRQYAIIQTTFFWMPNASSRNNAEQMIQFLLLKTEKLKPGGKIRIILGSQNGTTAEGDASLEPLDKHDQYRTAATAIASDPRVTASYNVRIIDQLGGASITYAEALGRLGLNPALAGAADGSHIFEHTQTEKPRKVPVNQDLIIQAVKRPPAQEPAAEAEEQGQEESESAAVTIEEESDSMQE